MGRATYVSNRVNVDVILLLLLVRHEWLDEELSQNTMYRLDLLDLAGSLSNPRLGLGPRLVEGQKTALASPLDQLIWLCDKLGTGLEKPWIGDLGLVQNVLDLGILGEMQRC